jgi:hypothetical protein
MHSDSQLFDATTSIGPIVAARNAAKYQLPLTGEMNRALIHACEQDVYSTVLCLTLPMEAFGTSGSLCGDLFVNPKHYNHEPDGGNPSSGQSGDKESAVMRLLADADQGVTVHLRSVPMNAEGVPNALPEEENRALSDGIRTITRSAAQNLLLLFAFLPFAPFVGIGRATDIEGAPAGRWGCAKSGYAPPLQALQTLLEDKLGPQLRKAKLGVKHEEMVFGRDPICNPKAKDFFHFLSNSNVDVDGQPFRPWPFFMETVRGGPGEAPVAVRFWQFVPTAADGRDLAGESMAAVMKLSGQARDAIYVMRAAIHGYDNSSDGGGGEGEISLESSVLATAAIQQEVAAVAPDVHRQQQQQQQQPQTQPQQQQQQPDPDATALWFLDEPLREGAAWDATIADPDPAPSSKSGSEHASDHPGPTNNAAPRPRFWTGETPTDRVPRIRADIPIVPACIQAVANLVNDAINNGASGLINVREQLMYEGDMSLDYVRPIPMDPAQVKEARRANSRTLPVTMASKLDIRRALLRRDLATAVSIDAFVYRSTSQIEHEQDSHAHGIPLDLEPIDVFAIPSQDAANPRILPHEEASPEARRKRQAILRATGCWALSPEHSSRTKRDDIAYAISMRTLYRDDKTRNRHRFGKKDDDDEDGNEDDQQQPEPNPSMPADCIYHPTNLFPVEREVSGSWTADCVRPTQIGFDSYFSTEAFVPGGLVESEALRQFKDSTPTTFNARRCKVAAAQALIRWSCLKAVGCDFPPMSSPQQNLAVQGLFAKNFKGFPHTNDVVFFDPVGCMPHIFPRLASSQTLFQQPLFMLALRALRHGTDALYGASELEQHEKQILQEFTDNRLTSQRLQKIAKLATHGPHILRQALQLLLVASQDYYVDAMYARNMQRMLIQAFRAMLLQSCKLNSHVGPGAICVELTDQEQLDRALQAVDGVAKDCERTAAFWFHDRKVLAFNACIGFLPDMRIVANMQHGSYGAGGNNNPPPRQSRYNGADDGQASNNPVPPLAAMASHVTSDIIPISLQPATRRRYECLFGSWEESEATGTNSYFETQLATHVCARTTARIDSAMRRMSCVYTDLAGTKLTDEESAKRAYGDALGLALENMVQKYNMTVAQRLIDDPLLPMAHGDRQGLSPLLGKTFAEIVPEPFADTGYGGVKARALFTMAAVDAMREIGGVRYVVNTPMLILRTFLLTGWYTIGMGAERPMLILCGPPGAGKTFFTFVCKYFMPPGTSRQVTSLTAHALRVTCAVRETTIFDDIEDDALRGGNSARGSNSTLKADLKHIGTTGALQIQQPNLHKPDGLRSGSSAPVKRDSQTSYAMYQGPIVINSNLRRRGDSGAEQQIDDAIASRALVPAAVCTTRETNIPAAASMRLAMMARPRGHELHEALGSLSAFQITSTLCYAYHTLVWVGKVLGVDLATASPVIGAILNNVDELNGRAGGGLNSARFSGQLQLHTIGQVVMDAAFLIQMGNQGRCTRIDEASGLPRKCTFVEVHQRMQPFAYPTAQQIAFVVASAEDCFGIATPRLLPDLLCSVAKSVYGSGHLRDLLFMKEYVPLESAQYGVRMQQLAQDKMQSLVEAANLNYVIDPNLSAPTLDQLYRKVANLCFRNQSLEDGAVKSLLDSLQQQTVPLTRQLDQNDPEHPPKRIGQERAELQRLGVERLDIAAMEKLAAATQRNQAAINDVLEGMVIHGDVGNDDDDDDVLPAPQRVEQNNANPAAAAAAAAASTTLSREEDMVRRYTAATQRSTDPSVAPVFPDEVRGRGMQYLLMRNRAPQKKMHTPIFAGPTRIMQGIAVHEDDTVPFSNIICSENHSKPEHGVACVNPIPKNVVKRVPMVLLLRDWRGYHVAFFERVLRSALLERPMSCIDAAIQKAFSCSNLNCYPDEVVEIACKAAGGTNANDTRMVHENATVKQVLDSDRATIFTTTPAVELSRQLSQQILGSKAPVDSNLAELVATQALSTIELRRTDKQMNLAVGMRPHGGVVQMVGRGTQHGLDKARPGVMRAVRVAAVNGTDVSYADPGSIAPKYDFDFINMAAQALRCGGNPYSPKWVATLPIFSRDGNLQPVKEADPPVTWSYPEDPLRQYYIELKRNMDMEAAPAATASRGPLPNQEIPLPLAPADADSRKRSRPENSLEELGRMAVASVHTAASTEQGDESPSKRPRTK